MRIAIHLAALALVAVDVVARAGRLRVILNVPLARAIVVNTCGDAVGAITPARVGGEPIRYVGLRRAGVEPGAILGAFGTEFVLDALLLILITLCFFLGYPAVAANALDRIVHLAQAPKARWAVGATVVLIAAGIVVIRRVRHRFPPRWNHSLRTAWREMRARPPGVTAVAVMLTFTSIAARTAILPLLVPATAHVPLGSVIFGSFALLYSQDVLPTPAGAGGVELGFVAGFAGTLSASALTRLLLLWRFYTIGLGAVVGAALLMRNRFGRGPR